MVINRATKIAVVCFFALLVLQVSISMFFGESADSERGFIDIFDNLGGSITGFVVKTAADFRFMDKFGGNIGNIDIDGNKLKLSLSDSFFNAIIDLTIVPDSARVFFGSTSDKKIATDVIYLEGLEFSRAVLILPKSNPVTSIVKCDSFDVGGFSCMEWVKTNIQFVESDNFINFEVSKVGTYAGFFDEKDLDVSQIKIEVKNKFGNKLNVNPLIGKKDVLIRANESSLNLNGVKSTKVSIFLDNTQNATIKTPVIYIPSVNLENAVITLPKNGKVETIYKCDKFDLGGFNCLKWIKSNVSFVDLGNSVRFQVNSFSAYAGGILSAFLSLNLGSKDIETRNIRPYTNGYKISLRPLQFKDSGEWIDIMPVNNLSDRNYSHVIIKPEYKALVSRSTKKSLMQLRVGNSYANYALENAQHVIPEVLYDKNSTDKRQTILFNNIQENVDLRYTLNDSEVKEDIILNEFGNNKFKFMLDTDNIKLSKQEDGNYYLTNIINNSFDVVLLKPFMVDSNYRRSDDVKVSLDVRGSTLILEIEANKTWLESAEYPVVIDPTLSVRANSTNAFSCDTDNITMNCRPATNLINLPNTETAAVLDFNVSELVVSGRNNISAVSLELACDVGPAFDVYLVNVTTPAVTRNLTEDINGLYTGVMSSNTLLSNITYMSCTNPNNVTFSDEGLNQFKTFFSNMPQNLRYFPIGINVTNILFGSPSFNNELGAAPPSIYFNLSFMNTAPTQGTPILNSTTGANITTENLTLYNVSTNDAESDIVKSIVTWKRNNQTWYLLYYPFEDNRTGGPSASEGPIFGDYSGNNRNASTANSSALYPGQQPLFNVTGINHSWSNLTRSGGINFNGRGDVVMATTSPEFNKTNFSVSLWFYNELNSGDSKVLISKKDVNADAGGNNLGEPITSIKGWQILANATLQTSCLDAGNKTSVMCFDNATTGIATNATHYVVMTYSIDTGIAYMYLDGVVVGSAGNSTTKNFDFTSLNDLSAGSFSARNISIGAGSNQSIGGSAEFRHFKGWIDEVIIYNSTLTIEQIRAIYNDGNPAYNIIVSQELIVNDAWHAIVTGNDNFTDGAGVTSNAVRILSGAANTAPNVSQAWITQSVVYTNTTTINVSANYSDAEGDNGNVNFVLFVNSIRQNESTVNGIVSGHNTSVLFGNNWNKTNNLTIQVNATDGNLLSAYINSSVNVSDVIPGPGTPAITPPSPNITNTLTSYSIVTDSDLNDKINVTITWFKNDAAIRTFQQTDRTNNTNLTDTLAPGNFTGGDLIIVQYNASEGGQQTHFANSTSVEVGLRCNNLNSTGTTYNMDRSLNVPGSCFNITASDVVLDCQGYQINFSMSSTGYGINVTGYANSFISNITIRNCDIHHNSTQATAIPVLFSYVLNSTIWNSTLNTSGSSSRGMDIISSSNNTIYLNKISSKGDNILFSTTSQNNTILNNNLTGVNAGNDGIDLSSSGPNDNNKIIGNYIYNILIGVRIANSIGNNLTYNNISTMTDDNAHGILITGGGNNTLAWNNVTTYNSRGINIYIQSSSRNNTVIYNLLKAPPVGGTPNVAGGILLENSDYNNVSHNNISSFGGSIGGSGASGLYLDSSKHNWLYNNTIWLDSASVAALAVASYSINNTFKENNVSKAGEGIGLTPGVDGNSNPYPIGNNTYINNSLNHTGANTVDLRYSQGVAVPIDGNVFEDQIISNYNLGSQGGKLIVRKTGVSEIIFLSAVNGSGTNFSGDIQIENGFVYVNTSNNIGLNSSANISISGTPGSNFYRPGLFYGSARCSSSTDPPCVNLTEFDAETVIFNVTSFSNYSVGENNTMPVMTTPTIIPSSPDVTDTLNATTNVSDVDTGDKMNVTITWFRNNVAIRAVQRYDLTNNTNATDNLAPGNFTSGDTIIAQFNVSQGFLDSVFSNSSSVAFPIGAVQEKTKKIVAEIMPEIELETEQKTEAGAKESAVSGSIGTVVGTTTQEVKVGATSEAVALDKFVDVSALVTPEVISLKTSIDDGVATLNLEGKSIITIDTKEAQSSVSVETLSDSPVESEKISDVITGSSFPDNIQSLATEVQASTLGEITTSNAQQLADYVGLEAPKLQNEMVGVAQELTKVQGEFAAVSEMVTSSVDNALGVQQEIRSMQNDFGVLSDSVDGVKNLLSSVDVSIGQIQTSLAVGESVLAQSQAEVDNVNGMVDTVKGQLSGSENTEGGGLLTGFAVFGNNLLTGWQTADSNEWVGRLEAMESEIRKAEVEADDANGRLEKIMAEVNESLKIINEGNEKIKKINENLAGLGVLDENANVIEKTKYDAQKTRFTNELLDENVKIAKANVTIALAKVIKAAVSAKNAKLEANRIIKNIMDKQSKGLKDDNKALLDKIVSLLSDVDKGLKISRDELNIAKLELEKVSLEFEKASNRLSLLGEDKRRAENYLLDLNKKASNVFDDTKRATMKEGRLVKKASDLIDRLEMKKATAQLIESISDKLGLGIVIEKPSVRTIQRPKLFIGKGQESEIDLMVDGVSRVIAKDGGLSFVFNSKKHGLKVLDIQDSKAVVEISSKPIQIEISPGESKDIDLDLDGVNDVRVVSNGVVNGNLDVNIVLINTAGKKEIVYVGEPSIVKVAESQKIYRDIDLILSERIKEESQIFLDSNLKEGLDSNVLVLPGKNYAFYLENIQREEVLLKFKNVDIKLYRDKPVLADLDNDRLYELFILYNNILPGDVVNLIVWRLPPNLQKEIYKMDEKRISELRSQYNLESKSKVVYWSFIQENFLKEFIAVGKTHQFRINKITEYNVNITIDEKQYNLELNMPLKIDLDRNNKIDAILTYEKFVDYETIRFKIEEITDIDFPIDKRLFELQKKLSVSSKEIYNSVLSTTTYPQKFVLGYNRDHYFKLKQVNQTEISVDIDNKEYTFKLLEPLRLDVNKDGIFDVVVNYEAYFGNGKAKVTIREITGFNKITAMAITDVFENKIPMILGVLGIIMIIFVIVGFYRFVR